MALTPDGARRGASQENLLLDYVRRLEKHQQGRRVVHLRLSALRPFNRREHHVRAAAHSFEPLVAAMAGQLFTLRSADLIFIYKQEVQGQVETIAQRIRFLFSEDPLMSEEGGHRFVSWYNVETDYDAVLALARGLVSTEQRRDRAVKSHLDTRSALKAKQQMGEPLTPRVLARIVDALARADLANMVRRQYVCSFDEQMAPSAQFSELFISIVDLRETLLPGVNLASNRWLFQHLTESLDRRMLAMLRKTDHLTISGEISFNLNVSTLLSPEFMTFDEDIPASRRGSMVIELQQVDIFADLAAYLFAREFVQDKGYRVCIDGLTHHTLGLVDRERLGADMIKVIWHPDMVDGGPEMMAEIQRLVRRNNARRTVLCRVDSREAVDFGRAAGFELFQGRHVENLIAEDSRRRELLRLKRRIERG
ncbi:MAG: EAL domain-containing protein [Hyphomicrobiales bacterium]|nr:EAL domain-containing protein [Hyphomicrobiales bacterium]MCP5370114.1 EAL domain-containing protein [Hyphomicrobiales bacterium]